MYIVLPSHVSRLKFQAAKTSLVLGSGKETLAWKQLQKNIGPEDDRPGGPAHGVLSCVRVPHYVWGLRQCHPSVEQRLTFKQCGRTNLMPAIGDRF